MGCFVLIVLAGAIPSQSLLKSGLLFFGLASGMITAGATSLMLDLTVAETAGTFIGAWGLAQAITRGLSTVLGGVVLNFGKMVFTVPVLAYGLVFVIQGFGMIVAIWLLGKVNLQEFRDNAKSALSVVIEGELDG